MKTGSENVEIKEFDDQIKVQLSVNQYDFEKLEQFQFALKENRHFFKGKIKEVKEEQLILIYEKNKYIVSLGKILKKMDNFERLVLAQKVNFLEDYLYKIVVPHIHPNNLFLFGQEVLVAHRGFSRYIFPCVIDKRVYFKRYRALILTILHPQFDYELLLEGASILQDTLSKKIQKAESFSKINEILGEQIAQQKLKRLRTQRLVKRNNYLVYKWGSAILLTVTLFLTILNTQYMTKVLPEKERIIEAKASFIAKDYAKTVASLKEDIPEKLPKSAQYALAVSALQLENLSNEQKKSVMNNLSQRSSTNTLLYWIYIGYGHFEQALDTAQNLGDDQYILHAYTKLYDATKANNRMSGSKKQKLLKTYEEAINYYLEILGGTEDAS